ncbi:SusC/RagA family TonB-linked outer membrane protein [Limibacter armeniacum]|uniref:SusC/RagA family TonB-linked outer membrane protein n=1 Tax=Limibacter armeniacum TaxID=466084 RepID=UPI002FE5A994
MKKSVLVVILLSCWLIAVHAQDRRITGTVTDINGPLPGVTVLMKGTQEGVVTGIDGKYTIPVSPTITHLVYSFIGYETIEREIGNQTVIDVQMAEDTQELDEVIVTANAIEREKRTLGYAVTSVKGEEFVKARSTNFVNSLSGKVPGVQVSQASGNLGGSSRIVIRGTSSLSGNNQPLFVVDGVPIGNSTLTTGSNIQGAFDAGNGAGEVNPADIESVTILKGASAAALYGSRAANGAVIITTKRGSKKAGPVVSFNSSSRFEQPLRLPDFQNEYAQGSEGKYDVNALNGWGPKIEGQIRPYYNYDLDINNVPTSDWPTEALTAYPDNVKDFYETGTLFINTVDVSNASEKGDFRIGFTSMNQTGIVPGADLNRYTLSVNVGQKVSKVLTTRVGLNYVKSDTRGSVAQGGNSPNVLTSIMNGIPRTVPLERLRLNADGTQNPISQFQNSPYWVAEKNGNDVSVDRIFGFLMADIQATDWLSFTARGGLDYRDDERFRKTATGTLGARDGSFMTDISNRQEVNFSLMAKVNKDVGTDFKVSAVLGQDFNIRKFTRDLNEAQGLLIPDVYTPGNAASNTPNRDISEKRLAGVYGDLSVTYKKFLTLNLTGRNDWSSTLPKENRSYFYPSANLSLIFTEALQIGNDILSYGKFRAGAAQVGSDTSPYQLQYYYRPRTSYFGQYGQSNNYPFLGQSTFAGSSVAPAQDLKPERQTSWEVGTELQFFDGRLGLDLTYYDIRTSDQIIAVPIPESTGLVAELMNAGEVRNNGFEILLSAKPLQVGEFSWDTQVNFSNNQFQVVSLEAGLERLQIASAFNGVSVQAEVGQPLQLYGVGFKKDPETGAILVDPETGRRLIGENQSFGSTSPDFLLGWQNSFQWKGISASFLIDWSQGGVMYSSTVASLRSSGVVEETIVNRGGLFVDQDAMIEREGTLYPNDIAITPQQFWSTYSSSDIAEGSVFDKTYIKFREVRVSYSLPQTLLVKTFIKKASIGIEGRNLAILYSTIPHIDPETSLFQASSDASGAVEMGSLPSTRSIGFNLQVTF